MTPIKPSQQNIQKRVKKVSFPGLPAINDTLTTRVSDNNIENRNKYYMWLIGLFGNIIFTNIFCYEELTEDSKTYYRCFLQNSIINDILVKTNNLMEPIETNKIVELINYCSKKMSFFEYDVIENIRKRKAEVAQPFIAFVNNFSSHSGTQNLSETKEGDDTNHP